MSSVAKQRKSVEEKSAPKSAKKEAQEASMEQKRIVAVIEEFADKAPKKLKPYIRQAAPLLAALWTYFMIALPYIAQGCTKAHEFASQVPENVFWMIFGFVVCFFGGVFPATIAAFEAARLCGVREAVYYVKELYGEWEKVQKAEVPAGDGEVKSQDTSELLVKKSQLVLKHIDPEKVNHSIVGLYTGWIGVMAALKIRFAKTVTLGSVIGEKLYEIAQQVEPAGKALVPEEYQKWVPVSVKWACKAVAITVAWWIERIFSALHSAVRGGTLFGRQLVAFMKEKEYIKVDHEDTYIDEVAGWAVAALGLLFQLYNGFHVPFPLNLVLWPAQLVEAFIIWSVSMV